MDQDAAEGYLHGGTSITEQFLCLFMQTSLNSPPLPWKENGGLQNEGNFSLPYTWFILEMSLRLKQLPLLQWVKQNCMNGIDGNEQTDKG